MHNPIDTALLARLEPIASLSPARRHELASLCIRETIPAGMTLFREGERDNQAVYVLRGEVVLSSTTGQHIQILSPSDNQAEAYYPIADKQPRQVSGVTVSDVDILRLDEDALDALMAWDQCTAPDPNKPAPADGRGLGWMHTLKQTLAFKNLPAIHVEKLASQLQAQPVTAGQVIIREGDAGQYYYLIDQGRAQVTRETLRGTEQVAELAAGEGFGEEALVSGAPRNASVSMQTDGLLLRLAKKDFQRLLREPLLHWIDARTALAQVKSGRAKWLDVRHAAEFAHDGLANALSCPLHELRQRATRLDNNWDYFCYCRTGRRSAAAAFLLRQRGLNAYTLKNGLQNLPGLGK